MESSKNHTLHHYYKEKEGFANLSTISYTVFGRGHLPICLLHSLPYLILCAILQVFVVDVLAAGITIQYPVFVSVTYLCRQTDRLPLSVRGNADILKLTPPYFHKRVILFGFFKIFTRRCPPVNSFVVFIVANIPPELFFAIPGFFILEILTVTAQFTFTHMTTSYKGLFYSLLPICKAAHLLQQVTSHGLLSTTGSNILTRYFTDRVSPQK